MNFKVDYQKMATVSQTLEQQIEVEISNNLQDIYNEIGIMGNYWQGANYAKLVKKFNEIREPVMNEILKHICRIPNKINQIADIYKCAMDKPIEGSGTIYTTIQKMISNNLAVPDENAPLKYDEVKVKASRQNIKAKFDMVYNNIANIMEPINGIIWER